MVKSGRDSGSIEKRMLVLAIEIGPQGVRYRSAKLLPLFFVARVDLL